LVVGDQDWSLQGSGSSPRKEQKSQREVRLA